MTACVSSKKSDMCSGSNLKWEGITYFPKDKLPYNLYIRRDGTKVLVLNLDNPLQSITQQHILISPWSTVNTPKTGSPPRSMKAANASMKSFIAPKTNFIDVHVTAVPEISVPIVIKDISSH